MLSQETTPGVSLNQSKSKARGFIRVPQGKICRMAASDQDYDGLYTDNFLSSNIIVVHNKQKMSMIYADSSVDFAIVESEKKWVGDGANIKVFFKENGIVVYKQIFGAMPKIKPISESTRAISAKFIEGAGLVVEAPADKPEKTIRHPQENRLETVHNINVAFFYLLNPAYRFDEKIKNQWKEQVSKVVFEAGFWMTPNAQACNVHATVVERITKFKNKSGEEIQGAIYRKRIGSIQAEMDKMSESEKMIVQERIARISVSVAETIWCYYNQYKLHDAAIDAKEINEAYTKIQHNRAQIQFNCQSIYEAQSHDYLVTNFARMRSFIKKFFCREESIVSELNNRGLPFIDFMEMRIKNPLLDLKQLLESAGSIVPMEPHIVVKTSKKPVSKAPVKLAEPLSESENAEKTGHLASEIPAVAEGLENTKMTRQELETPVLDKPATNAPPVATVAQAANKALISKSPCNNQKKLAASEFLPLSQAKKAEAHDNTQESEGRWLPAPTSRKPVLQAPEFRLSAQAPEFRPNAFLSAWEETASKGSLNSAVSLVPQVVEKPPITVQLNDDHHFPALGKIKSGLKD